MCEISDSDYKTIDVYKREMLSRLSKKYGNGEAKAMINLIFHAFKGWNPTQIIINGNLRVSPDLQAKIESVLKRLEKDEPLQYILGEARFYGIDFTVSPAVLIPRQETEELVDLIVRENPKKDLRVLDIGTGSGAIAIALARFLDFPKVTALDISHDALEIARLNSKKHKADIAFLEEDIFRFIPEKNSFDIIVSNPPYIAEKEKAEMADNVLSYEPHLALFVPDNQPLVYYSRIAEIAAIGLVPEGKLYLEINPLYASELITLFEHERFGNLKVVKDISGRDRFLIASK